jgi:hypothetical protein
MAALLDHDSDAGAETRLQLDGLGTPIVTRVTRHGPRGMTVEQTLPFLRLQTVVVDEADQRSRIASVSMVVYDGIPRLVLDLAYDEARSAPVSALVRQAHRGVVRPRRGDDTAAFEREAVEQPVAGLDDDAALDEVLAQSDEPVGRESTLLFHTHPPLAAEPAHTPVDLTLEQELLQSRQLSYRLQQHWRVIEPIVARAGAAALRLLARGRRWLHPHLLRALGLCARALRALRLRLLRA